MNRVDVIKDVCVQLGLTQINNSWVKTLGAHLVIPELPGNDDYEQRVFTALFPSGTTAGGSVEIYDTFADFPTTGEDNVLYVTKDANTIYRYDSTLNTYVLTNDPDVVNPDAPEEGTTYYARTATTAALNACTYNNGTGGVNATLTGNVNGAIGQINSPAGLIDTISVSQGQVILVRAQASALQNGLYEITQLGNAGAPFILTRISGYDQTAEVYPSIVFTEAGSSSGNRYWTQTTQNPVIGTNPLTYTASSVAGSVTIPTMLVDTATPAQLDLVSTYSNGTIYPTTLPGFGANLRANSNGALGLVNGVTIISGMRILLYNCSNAAYNGVYTVTNAGSATQRWQLNRTVYSSGSLYKGQQFVVTHPNSNLKGSIWTITNPLTLSNTLWGTTPITFTQMNSVGLIDTNGNIDITTGSGNAALTMYEASGNAEISVDNDINLAASNNVNIDAIGGSVDIEGLSTYIHNTSETTYVDIDGANGKIQAFAQDGSDEVTLDLNPSNYNVFRTNGSSIFLSIDNVTFTNSNLLLQNNSAALRCYSANAVVEVTAGSNNMGMFLDRNTTLAGMYNNQGNLDFYSTANIVLSSDGATTITSLDATNITADAGISLTSNGSDIELDATGSGSIQIKSANDNIILLGSGTGLPTYANDAAADADANLQQGALYKVTGNRTVFQKP